MAKGAGGAGVAKGVPGVFRGSKTDKVAAGGFLEAEFKETRYPLVVGEVAHLLRTVFRQDGKPSLAFLPLIVKSVVLAMGFLQEGSKVKLPMEGGDVAVFELGQVEYLLTQAVEGRIRAWGEAQAVKNFGQQSGYLESLLMQVLGPPMIQELMKYQKVDTLRAFFTALEQVQLKDCQVGGQAVEGGMAQVSEEDAEGKAD